MVVVGFRVISPCVMSSEFTRKVVMKFLPAQVSKQFCPFKDFLTERTQRRYRKNVSTHWALSIYPKISEIFGTSNRKGHFGLVRPEYSRPPLKVVHFRSVGRKCPFPFDKIVVPSTALLYPVYKNNNQTRGSLCRVWATGMYRSIGHVTFPKFQTGVFVRPRIYFSNNRFIKAILGVRLTWLDCKVILIV